MSCTQTKSTYTDKIHLKLGSLISNKCIENINCSIKLTEVTQFNWDKMYYIDHGIDAEEITQIIGREIKFTASFTKKLIFFNNNKIAYFEEIPSHVDQVIDGNIGFFLGNRRYVTFEPNSTFNGNIIKSQIREKVITTYTLKCLNCIE